MKGFWLWFVLAASLTAIGAPCAIWPDQLVGMRWLWGKETDAMNRTHIKVVGWAVLACAAGAWAMVVWLLVLIAQGA